MVALALAALAGPWIFDASRQTVLTDFFILLTLAMCWNLLAGYADMSPSANRVSSASAPMRFLG